MKFPFKLDKIPHPNKYSDRSGIQPGCEITFQRKAKIGHSTFPFSFDQGRHYLQTQEMLHHKRKRVLLAIKFLKLQINFARKALNGHPESSSVLCKQNKLSNQSDT